ncbi:MAG: hypothetical protein EBZ48_00290 [Proteobacteria bacterium]|nr:hypothetical protein [Pseudomonadota bacterium]
MQRSPLYSFLEKVASGDDTYRLKLCQQLADRLIYVPILERASGEPSSPGQFKVRVVRTADSEGEQVLLFTTEKLYKGWATTFPEKTSFISLLGGDFCAALKSTTCVVVDSGTAHSVVLKPESVRAVAHASPDDGLAPALPESTRPAEELRGRSEPTSFIQRPKFTANSSGVSPAAQLALGERQPADITGRPQSLRSSNAEDNSERTELTRTYEEQNSEEPNPSIQYSSGQRPVIFSPDSDSNLVVREKESPGRKRKKSLLNFLKGS